MHGGTVEAHSAGLGQGSEFIVRLPVLLSSTAASQQSPAREQRSRPRRARAMLVVDDNVDAADMLAMLLQDVRA